MKGVLRFLGFSFILILGIIFPSFSFADDTIQGHYCYSFGDRESLQEARDLTRSLVIRNAIEYYRAFITSTSTVKNFQLTNDLVQMISTGYLKDIRVIEHKEEGKTICETIQAMISSQAVENIIKQAKWRAENIEEKGIANNGYLKILYVRKTQKTEEDLLREGNKLLSGGKVGLFDVVVVTAKNLKPTFSSQRFASVSPMGGADLLRVWEEEKLRLAEWTRYLKVCIDFFDVNGNPVNGATALFPLGGIGLMPGEIRNVIFEVPDEAQSWRVWLPEESLKE